MQFSIVNSFIRYQHHGWDRTDWHVFGEQFGMDPGVITTGGSG